VALGAAVAVFAGDEPPAGYCAPNQRPVIDMGSMPPSTYGAQRPSPKATSAYKFTVGCFFVTTGRAGDCSICLQSWVEPQGSLKTGHAHDLGRQLQLFFSRGVIWSDLESKPFFTSTGYKGRTHWRDYNGVLAAPEAAAIIRYSHWSKVHDGPGLFFQICSPAFPEEKIWKCIPPENAPAEPELWMPKEAYYDGVVTVGWVGAWPGLKYLGPHESYIRCDYWNECVKQNGESIGHREHPNPFYGTETLVKLIPLVADWVLLKMHYVLDHAILVGDMSLPWGGLFDLNARWSPPHRRHRLGGEVDISDRYIYEFNRDSGWHRVREMTSNEKERFVSAMEKLKELVEKFEKEHGKGFLTIIHEEKNRHYHLQLSPPVPVQEQNPGCVAALAPFSGCPLESYPQ
jgi:hypothetical protein